MEMSGLEEYKASLNLLEQNAQNSYDRTVIILSGGGLGISLTFVDKILEGSIIVAKNILIMTWVCWGLSLAIVLASFLSSQYALRKAIAQVNKGVIYDESPGGWFDKITKFLNIASGSFFLIGLILLVIFVAINMGGK